MPTLATKEQYNTVIQINEEESPLPSATIQCSYPKFALASQSKKTKKKTQKTKLHNDGLYLEISGVTPVSRHHCIFLATALEKQLSYLCDVIVDIVSGSY